MAQWKANKKYFELGEKKDFRSLGGHSKHGRLVAGNSLDIKTLPNQFKDCFDEVGKKKTKTTDKKESK